MMYIKTIRVMMKTLVFFPSFGINTEKMSLPNVNMNTNSNAAP